MTPARFIPPVHFAALRAADGITHDAIGGELAREADHRAAVYKVEVAKGRMTRAQADYGQAIFETMAMDIRRMARSQPPADNPRFTWGERRDALLREMDRRAALYPEWIAKGRLTPQTARRRTECLAAALDAYEGGLDYPRRDPTPANRAHGTQIYIEFLLRRDLASPDTLRAAYPDATLPAEQQSLAV